MALIDDDQPCLAERTVRHFAEPILLLAHEDRDTLLALVTFNRDNGNIASALEYAERLAQLAPADRQVSELIDALKRQLKPAPQ